MNAHRDLAFIMLCLYGIVVAIHMCKDNLGYCQEFCVNSLRK